MSNTTTLKTVESGTIAAPTLQQTSPLFDGAMFGQMMEIAKVMATATMTVPTEYQNKPGNCLAVIEQAFRWRMSPFAVAQKTHFVSGKIGYEAQLVNAAIISSGALRGTPDYEWYGDWDKILGKFKELESKKKQDEHGNPVKYRVPDWPITAETGLGVKVSATLAGETDPRVLDLKMTQARVRNSTLWADDPRQQLAYLAIKRWARLHAPQVLLGVYTPDELAEPEERFMGNAEVEPTDTKPKTPPPPLPDYTAEQLAANLPKWQAAIAKGSTTADRVIATVRTKYVLSDAQLAAIRAPVKPEAPAAPEAPAEPTEQNGSGAPEITAEIIEKRLRNAEDAELLGVAADLIGEIPDAAQRTRLVDIYHECQQNFQPE